MEREEGRKYEWGGYLYLLAMLKAIGLKLQVVMSFHACGNGLGDDVNIPLPKWVLAAGESNKDIFYKDAEGNVCTESISLGVDNVCESLFNLD